MVFNDSSMSECQKSVYVSHEYFIILLSTGSKGHALAQLVEALRCKPEGRGFDGIFHWHVVLGSTHPLTEMSTRNISWVVKVVGLYGRQRNHLHVSTVLISRSLNLLEPSGTAQACTGIIVIGSKALSFGCCVPSSIYPTKFCINVSACRSGFLGFSHKIYNFVALSELLDWLFGT